MLIEMASKISKRYTYKGGDSSRHNRIKGAMTNVHTNHTHTHGQTSVCHTCTIKGTKAYRLT